MNIKKLLAATALVALPLTGLHAEPSAEEVVSRYGKIVEKRAAGSVGMTAWTVEKNGKELVLYTTAEGKNMAVIAGVVWDNEGRQISSMPLQVLWSEKAAAAAQQHAPQSAAATVAAMSGSFSGEIPPAMRTVDALQGVKEGQGGIGDTVYVIIDPRCPYCQQAYQLTRPYVAKGHTIKWIPTTALGDKANGVPIAATILQQTDPAVLARVLGKHEQIRTAPTPETEKALDLNLQFMFAAFEQNGGKPGVPVAFYIDHRTGKPQMMTGLTDQVVLQDIFGQLEGAR